MQLRPRAGRITGLISGAALVGAFGAVPAAWAAPSGASLAEVGHAGPSVTLRTDDRDGRVAPGRILFHGRVAGARAGHIVRIQKWRGPGQWETVRRVAHSGDFHFRHPLPAGTHKIRAVVPHPAGRLESSAVRVVAVQGLGSYSSCTEAYYQHTNYHNICTTFANQTRLFTGPGVLGTQAPQNMWFASQINNNSNRTVECDDDGSASFHHRTQDPATWIGDSTWAFCSAQSGYDAMMSGTWQLTLTPVDKDGNIKDTGANQVKETLDFGIGHGVGDGGKYANCSSGTYFDCYLSYTDVNVGGSDVERKTDLRYANAPLLIQLVNRTGQVVSWSQAPELSAVLPDPRGSSYSDVSQPTSIAPGATVYLAGYRRMDGTAASLSMQLSFPDSQYVTNETTHNLITTFDIAPKKGSDGKLPGDHSAWEGDTSGSVCQDRPYGRYSSGLTVDCAVDWRGVKQWPSPATAVLTLNNRN